MTYSVVIIDGRSGSGKTTLAVGFAERLSTPGQPAQTLHLDSLYPGWDGLAAGSAAVARVLEQQWYQPYDWAEGAFFDSRITLDPSRALVIEGCGALTLANLESARQWSRDAEVSRVDTVPAGAVRANGVHSVWIECDEALRRTRALDRDGDMFAPHWDRWAVQEQAQFSLHRPWMLADELARSE